MKKRWFSILVGALLIVCMAIPVSAQNSSDSSDSYVMAQTASDTSNKNSQASYQMEAARGVSAEMLEADYWKNTSMVGKDRLLATAEEIAAYNESAMNSEGTNMNDLENLPNPTNLASYRLSITDFASVVGYKGYDPTSETVSLVYILNQGITMDIRNYYKQFICGVNEEYVTTDVFVYDEANASNYIESPEVTKMNNVYMVCTRRAELTNFPCSDYLRQNNSTAFSNLADSMLCVNEPFVAQRSCVVNGRTYVWGYSRNCIGWVPADCFAICQSKEQWTSLWKVDTTSKDILVVAQDQITLEYSNDASVSEVRLDMGTILSLCTGEEAKSYLNLYDGRNAYNSYVVYLPTRIEAGANAGKLEIKKAIIPKHYKVSIGFVPLTESNILDISFSCLGDIYGWGGSAKGLDCTMYTRNLYRCFGYEMPRNTTWQPKVNGYTTNLETLAREALPTDLSEAETTAFIENYKKEYIATLPIGSILYISRHAMVYIGCVDGMPYCISAVGTVVDNDEGIIQKIGSVIVNPLTMKRGNGTTWLYNIDNVISFTSLRHTEHVEQTIAPKAATCTETGLSEGIICSLCSKILQAQTVTEKAAHSYGAWTTVTSPNCTAKGVKQHACTKCNYTETSVVNANGHHSVPLNAVAATCSSVGRTAGSKCSECGVILVEQRVISRLSHSYTTWEVVKSATCTEQGFYIRNCKNCSKYQVKRPAALGHKAVTDKAVSATALKTGLTKGSHCKRCNIILVKQKTVKKLTPTISLSAKTKKVKVGKTFVLSITGLAKGDYVKAVKSASSGYAAVKKLSTGKYKITAKKKGTVLITVTLASKKTATCKLTIV